MANMTLAAWTAANNATLGAHVRQGAQCLVVFATLPGKDKATPLIISKGLSKSVSPGDSVLTLANMIVRDGNNALGEPRTYIGRDNDDTPEVTAEDMLKAAASQTPAQADDDLPF
jgi:hypothetical protein